MTIGGPLSFSECEHSFRLKKARQENMVSISETLQLLQEFWHPGAKCAVLNVEFSGLWVIKDAYGSGVTTDLRLCSRQCLCDRDEERSCVLRCRWLSTDGQYLPNLSWDAFEDQETYSSYGLCAGAGGHRCYVGWHKWGFAEPVTFKFVLRNAGFSREMRINDWKRDIPEYGRAQSGALDLRRRQGTHL